MDEPKRYESIKYVVGISKFILDVFVLIFLLTSGWSLRVRALAQSAVNSEWLTIVIYVLVIGALLSAIEWPLAFYSGYILEHRFGLSRQSFAGWMKDQLKGLALSVPLSIAAIEFIYFLLRRHPDVWWVYSSAAFVAFIVVMANLAPVVLLPLFFKFKPVDNADLQSRVNRLARRTGTHVCGIFEWSLGDKTRKANAAVVGWGNTRRIIVSDTLLENFSGEEIEVILAHELCHHVKNHIWQGIALQSSMTFAGFYVAGRLLPRLSMAYGFRGVADIAGLPLLVLVMMTLSLAGLPVVNSFSRRLETAADSFALDV